MKSSILLLLLFFAQLVVAQSLSEEKVKAIDKIATAYTRDTTPGAAVGIVKNGVVIYEKYVGLADLDSKRAIDEQTRFNLASLAKQFTALCVLKLVQEEKLNLDDDIRKFLPRLLPNIDSRITVKQLLNHTSGIRGFTNLLSLQGITWWEAKLNNDDVLSLLERQEALNYPPGSRRIYTNSNYVLLTHIIAKVTGQSFQDYARGIFRELGMPNTFFHADFNEPVERMARPYFNFDTWLTYDLLSNIHGDGALYSTLPDQLRWEVLLQQVTRGTSKLSPEWISLLRASQEPLGGDGSYGFGLEFGYYRGVPYRFHDGSTGAWKASTVRFPEHGLTIFAATNSGALWPPGTVKELADILLPADQLNDNIIPRSPTEVAPAQPLEKILGTYRTEDGFFCRIKKQEGKTYLERPGRSDIEIQPETGGLYHEVTDTAFKQHFTANDSGVMTVTFYYPDTEPFTFISLPDVIGWPTYDQLNGIYQNAETDASFRLTHQKDGRYSVKFGSEELIATLYTPNEMLMSGYRFEINRSANGNVQELRLFDGRLQNVRFVMVNEEE